jgi:hypothetical protein
MNKPWFGAKRFGFGLTPTSLAGWLATGALLLALSLTRPVVSALHGPAWAVYTVMLGLVAGYILLIARTSDGRALQWRWGGRD